MSALSRRAFLAGSAATVAGPALAAPAGAADFDILIIGAGVAGIAAANRIAATGMKCLVLEAGDHLGGRCFTDTRIFGFPYERGARWIYTPDVNPLAKLAAKTGVNLEPAPRVPIYGTDRALRTPAKQRIFWPVFARYNRAISSAALEADVSCAQAISHDLDEWRATMEFMLGSFKCGESLNLISAVDFANSADRTLASSCPQGIGKLLGKLAVSSRIQFYSPVTQIQWDASLVKVETRSGVLTARAVIVTASTGVLGSGKIKFQPGLPARYIEAIGKLRLGSYDHVALEFDNNPLALKKDDLIFEKATGRRTAALLANVSGTGLYVVELEASWGLIWRWRAKPR
jgi:monoamine oxidase